VGGEVQFQEGDVAGIFGGVVRAEGALLSSRRPAAFVTNPFFLSSQIFSTGKSLNFMKYSCEDATWVVERNREEDRSASFCFFSLSSSAKHIPL
jgi:hypothetical protein